MHNTPQYCLPQENNKHLVSLGLERICQDVPNEQRRKKQRKAKEPLPTDRKLRPRTDHLHPSNQDSEDNSQGSEYDRDQGSEDDDPSEVDNTEYDEDDDPSEVDNTEYDEDDDQDSEVENTTIEDLVSLLPDPPLSQPARNGYTLQAPIPCPVGCPGHIKNMGGRGKRDLDGFKRDVYMYECERCGLQFTNFPGGSDDTRVLSPSSPVTFTGDPHSDRTVRIQTCKRCGMPRKGHNCPYKSAKAAKPQMADSRLFRPKVQQTCRHCGLLRKGHTCSVIRPQMIERKAKEETEEDTVVATRVEEGGKVDLDIFQCNQSDVAEIILAMSGVD